MTHVSVIFSVEDLDREIRGGWVRRQCHPDYNYSIYNYTEKAQFAKHWNQVTLNCRGLILDDSFNILARPWKKFFNLGEGYIEFDMNDPAEVTDKMDGSLGILYPTFHRKWNGGNPITITDWHIATRGSFNSEQAMHATELLESKNYLYEITPLDGWTYLFEIVYPSNRIVIDYHGMDDLVLLGAVNNTYGYYYSPDVAAATLNWRGPVVKIFDYKTLQEAFVAEDRTNAEGFVIRCGNHQVKLKQTDYLALHRIVTNLTEKRIWESMTEGKSDLDLCELFPDEFHSWIRKVYFYILNNCNSKRNEVCDEFDELIENLGDGFTRKDFAIVATKSTNAKYLFAILDDKDINPMLWRDCEPSAESKNLEG